MSSDVFPLLHINQQVHFYKPVLCQNVHYNNFVNQREFIFSSDGNQIGVCFRCIVFYSSSCIILFPRLSDFDCTKVKTEASICLKVFFTNQDSCVKSYQGSSIIRYCDEHGFLHFLLITQLFLIILNINPQRNFLLSWWFLKVITLWWLNSPWVQFSPCSCPRETYTPILLRT